jgi:hypothetical protein
MSVWLSAIVIGVVLLVLGLTVIGLRRAGRALRDMDDPPVLEQKRQTWKGPLR